MDEIIRSTSELWSLGRWVLMILGYVALGCVGTFIGIFMVTSFGEMRKSGTIVIFTVFLIVSSLSGWVFFTMQNQHTKEGTYWQEKYVTPYIESLPFEKASALKSIKVKEMIDENHALGQIIYEKDGDTNVYIGKFELIQNAKIDEFQFQELKQELPHGYKRGIYVARVMVNMLEIGLTAQDLTQTQKEPPIIKSPINFEGIMVLAFMGAILRSIFITIFIINMCKRTPRIELPETLDLNVPQAQEASPVYPTQEIQEIQEEQSPQKRKIR